jgi:hypothetical protein
MATKQYNENTSEINNRSGGDVVSLWTIRSAQLIKGSSKTYATTTVTRAFAYLSPPSTGSRQRLKAYCVVNYFEEMTRLVKFLWQSLNIQ